MPRKKNRTPWHKRKLGYGLYRTATGSLYTPGFKHRRVEPPQSSSSDDEDMDVLHWRQGVDAAAGRTDQVLVPTLPAPTVHDGDDWGWADPHPDGDADDDNVAVDGGVNDSAIVMVSSV